MDDFVDFIKHACKGLVSQGQLLQPICVESTKAAKDCGGLGGANQGAGYWIQFGLIRVAVRVDELFLARGAKKKRLHQHTFLTVAKEH